MNDNDGGHVSLMMILREKMIQMIKMMEIIEIFTVGLNNSIMDILMMNQHI